MCVFSSSGWCKCLLHHRFVKKDSRGYDHCFWKQSADDYTESHGRNPDLTANTEVKAPGVFQRAVEEVQAIAANIWESIVPSKK